MKHKIVMTYFIFVVTNTFLAFPNIRQSIVATIENFIAKFLRLRSSMFCCDILICCSDNLFVVT